jgi:hypothetical protein
LEQRPLSTDNFELALAEARIALRYHRYYYGGRYGALEGADERDMGLIFGDLAALEQRITTRLTSRPDARRVRTLAHLYATSLRLFLFARGVSPGFSGDTKPILATAASHLARLRSLVNVQSLATLYQIIVAAASNELFGDPEQLGLVRTIEQRDAEQKLLISYDRRLLHDYLVHAAAATTK